MNQKPVLLKFDQGEVSSTSVVNKYVRLGKGSKIWHFCNVYGVKDGEVIIGEDTQIGSHSEIKPNVKIGNHCRFQHDQYIPDHVTIGNYVFVGPGVTFLNDKYPSSYKSMNRKLEKLLSITIEEHTSIGGNVAIGPGIKIGKYCIIGMGSVVTKDVPDYSVIIGNPARIVGKIYEERFKRHYPEFKNLKAEKR